MDFLIKVICGRPQKKGPQCYITFKEHLKLKKKINNLWNYSAFSTILGFILIETVLLKLVFITPYIQANINDIQILSTNMNTCFHLK